MLIKKDRNFNHILVKFVFILFLMNISNPCKSSTIVYTIGDETYDKFLREDRPITKLGKLSTTDIPSGFPHSFLEADGSYGGGIVFMNIEEAEQGIKRCLENGVLDPTLHWNIYEIEVNLALDIYKSDQEEYRLLNSVNVKRKANSK